MRWIVPLAALAVSTSLGAAKPAPLQLSPQAREVIGSFIREHRGEMPDRNVAERLRDEILSLDMDGGGLSQTDLDTQSKLRRASRRAQDMIRYTRMDLDGDGKTTRVEYRVVVREKYAELEHILEAGARRDGKAPDYRQWFPRYPDIESHAEFAGVMAMYDAVDTDRDGAISLSESFAATARDDRDDRDNEITKAYRYLALDLDDNGTVSPAEIDRAVAAYLALRESAAAWETSPPKRSHGNWGGLVLDDAPEPGQVGAARSCAFPKPSSGAMLIRLGIYHGRRLSNVAVGGQDRATGIARVEIDPGKRPIYVVASQFDPTIWEFAGAVDRVERLVVASYTTDNLGRPSVGVTGLKPEKMTAIRLACVGEFWSDTDLGEQSEAGKLMKQHFGRMPDAVFGSYDATGISLPLAKPFTLPTLRPKALEAHGDADVEDVWSDIGRYDHGGVAELDPASIWTWSDAEPYETLPMEAGLVQLMLEGKIARLRYGEFIVQKPARLPADLSGGHSRTFIVLDGVPMPRGNPGHYCVRTEAQVRATKRLIC